MYEYRAVVERVHDGDTVLVDVDLGFGIWKRGEALRLIGIQAPENGTVQGAAATAYLKDMLPAGTLLRITTIKDKREKYGRMLADIFLAELHVNTELIDSGHAVPWNGKGARPSGF